MGKIIRALDVDLPEEVDFGSCDKFLKGKKEVKDAIDEIIKRQKKNQFFGKNKFHIGDDTWEKIYREIAESKYAQSQNTHSHLSPKYISKNHMVYGDSQLVLFFALQVYGGVLGLTPEQIKEFTLELETKIYGIDSILLHRRFLEVGGTVLRQGLFTDLEFDTRSGRLKSNGGSKIRTRVRNTLNHGMSEELTGKRKLSSAKDPQKELKKLNRLLDDMESSIDITSIPDDMKVLFEEPHSINDHEVLERNLNIIGLNFVSAKVKLRTSGVLDGTKLENENYFWAQSATSKSGFMEPFAELEAPSPEKSLEIRELLGIVHLITSTQGAKGVFEDLGAKGEFMEFMKGLKGDNEMFRKYLRVMREGTRLMRELGYFNDFPESI